jgi:hypothetical protein
MGTDNEEARGYAWTSQAGSSEPDSMASKLADAPVSESPTRSASGPAFCALREMKKLPRIGVQKKHGARPACRDGGVFEKTSARSLAWGFAKMPLHSRSEYTP